MRLVVEADHAGAGITAHLARAERVVACEREVARGGRRPVEPVELVRLEHRHRSAPRVQASGARSDEDLQHVHVPQPRSQNPRPVQPRALRRIAKCRQPSASQPREITLSIGPTSGCAAGATSRIDSTRSKCRVIASRDSSSVASSSHQRSRIHGGVRKQVPPLIAVEPPTSRPMKIGITALPTEIAAR